MPVKDHTIAFKTTSTSFKRDPSSKNVLSEWSKNDTLTKSMAKLNQMGLLGGKQLHVINHDGADKGLNSCVHT